MPLWGKNDAASNSTIYAAAQVNKAPNTANRDALFGNTTANAFITGATVGQFGVDANEVAAGGGKVAHTGWVLRTVGQGGRAGRVFNEVLVAGGIGTDAEDVTFPDYTLRVLTNPSNVSANITANESKTFTVSAASTPAGATLTYNWLYSTTNATAGFANASTNTAFSGATTATLTANAATLGVNTWVYAVVSATGASNVQSTTVKLTATS